MRLAGGSTRAWNLSTDMLRAVYCAALCAAFSAEAGQAQEPRPDLFTRLDVDKNGKVSREELPETQKPNFGRIDGDGDGAISREELNKYVGRDQKPNSGQPNSGRPPRGARLAPTHADVAYACPFRSSGWELPEHDEGMSHDGEISRTLCVLCGHARRGNRKPGSGPVAADDQR